MKLTKLDDKDILLTPQTAMEEFFIWYLTELINAKGAEVLKEIASLRLSYHSQDTQPLTIGSPS